MGFCACYVENQHFAVVVNPLPGACKLRQVVLEIEGVACDGSVPNGYIVFEPVSELLSRVTTLIAVGVDHETDRLGRREVLQHVGSAEGSHYSQGHYRLYFGLGPVESVDLRVVWPSGESQEFHGVKADRLITIDHNGLIGGSE